LLKYNIHHTKVSQKNVKEVGRTLRDEAIIMTHEPGMTREIKHTQPATSKKKTRCYILDPSYNRILHNIKNDAGRASERRRRQSTAERRLAAPAVAAVLGVICIRGWMWLRYQARWGASQVSPPKSESAEWAEQLETSPTLQADWKAISPPLLFLLFNSWRDAACKQRLSQRAKENARMFAQPKTNLFHYENPWTF